ncbi:MAG: IPT/TIG domain-containing protein [Acidobacteriota bacterium]
MMKNERRDKERGMALLMLTLAVAMLATTARSEEQETSSGGISDPHLVLVPPARPLPPAGSAFVEPVFGTTLRRVSNLSDSGGFETQIYSQLQAFSSDGAYLLTTGSQGYQVRRMSDLAVVSGLDLQDINVPRWHPARPHVLIHFDTNGDDDLSLQFTDVDAKTTRDVAVLPGYAGIFGNQSFDEVSRDGRWVAGLARRSSDSEPVIFAYDMIGLSFGAQMPLADLYDGNPCQPDPQWGQVWPDWIAPSPLGTCLVVQWPGDGTEGCRGMETYDIRSGAFIGRPYSGHQHGDLGISLDGREFFLTYETDHPGGTLAIGCHWLPGPPSGSGSPNYILTMGWHGAHISCQGPPGSCLITSSENPFESAWQPLEAELFLLDLNGGVLRLAHHRSTECGYWVQPRGTISMDGRYVAFASDWGRGGGCGGGGLGEGDPYVIELDSTPPSNRPPIAKAGADRSVPVGSAVVLDGTGSSDPDGDAITFSWRQTWGTSVALSGAATATPSFTAPAAAETLRFELTVRDQTLSASDQIEVTVSGSGGGAVPRITRVTSRGWHPGNVAVIRGQNFGSGNNETVVMIGGHRAPLLSSTSTRIRCRLPRQLVGNTRVDVYVIVDGRRSNIVWIRIRA